MDMDLTLNNDRMEEEYYSRYEMLLVEREDLYKRCESYSIEFNKEFGDMIISDFELKLECIKKKKMISYCRRMLNRGLKIDADLMNSRIESEMKAYYGQLDDLLAAAAAAKCAVQVGFYATVRSKKIYHEIVKVLHPDVNKKTSGTPVLLNLWDRTVAAYKKDDVEALEDLEVLVHSALEKLGDEGFELHVDDIEERIERIEKEIDRIRSTEPFTYGEILKNPDKKAAYMEELKAEHDNYDEYLLSLKKTLEEMICEGGGTIVWQMD